MFLLKSSLYHVMQGDIITHLERNAVWKFKEERLELPKTDFQVGVTKLIRYVPPQRPILDTLLNCCMKICESKHHFPPHRRLVICDQIKKLGV